MSTAAQHLASFAGDLRVRLDAGDISQARARLALRAAAQRLLALYPRDEALAAAFDVVHQGRFAPPAPTDLPDGTPLDVWRALETRAPQALDDLAATVLDPPDPEADPAAVGQAARVMELFLAAPSGADRATALLDRLRDHVAASAAALWALRLEAAGRGPDELGEPATWDALLAPLLAAAQEGTDADADADYKAAATGLRLAAAAVIAHAGAHGSSWMTPVLGGRRVANVSLALARRPALADDLAPALRWLQQAERLSPGRAEGGAEGLVSAADEADRGGRFQEGTIRLLRALERSGGREDLGEAVFARGLALLDAGLLDRAGEALGGSEGIDRGLDPDGERAAILTARAWRPAPNPAIRPVPPAGGWEEVLPRLAARPDVAEGGALVSTGDAAGDAPDEEGPREHEAEADASGWSREDLALLEAAGSVGRAARGWLARGEAPALLHAARLAQALNDAERGSLVDALRTAACADEEVLARDATGRAVATQLLALAPDASDAPLWELRLRAAAAGAGGDAPVGGTDASGTEEPLAADASPPAADPHSPSSRLAAAADLLAAGNLEAAGAILGALIRKLDAPELRERVVDLAMEILRQDDPPTAFVGQAARALVASGPVPAALVARLVRDPGAAYALHDSLRRAAQSDSPLGDLRRVELLEAWLGIWRATRTPPALDATRALMRHAPHLLALAAFRAAGASDPVTEAVTFVARHPPKKVTAERWADALVAL